MAKFFRNRMTIGSIPQLPSGPSLITAGKLLAKYFVTGVLTTPTTESAWNALFAGAVNDTRDFTTAAGIFWKQTSDASPTGAGAPPAPIAGTGATGIAYELSGYVYCPTAGSYSFIANTDDGGQVTIDDQIVFSYYNGRGCTADYSTTLGTVTPITLSVGWHKFRARMDEGGGGYGMAVGWKKPGDSVYTTIPISSYGY